MLYRKGGEILELCWHGLKAWIGRRAAESLSGRFLFFVLLGLTMPTQYARLALNGGDMARLRLRGACVFCGGSDRAQSRRRQAHRYTPPKVLVNNQDRPVVLGAMA